MPFPSWGGMCFQSALVWQQPITRVSQRVPPRPRPCQGSVGIVSTGPVGARGGKTQRQLEKEKEVPHARTTSRPLPGRG